MRNTNTSLENQDIISDIDDLLPKLKILQQKYEEDEHQKKLEDEAWEKRYYKAKAEFNKRSEDMLGMVKPIADTNSFKYAGTLYLGIFFLLWFIPPFSDFAESLGLFITGIGAFFILCVIYFPLSSKIDANTEQRIERTRKEIAEIKKREYPILFEREPSHGYWEKQYNYTKAMNERLKRENPQFEFVLTGIYGFSDTIKQMKYVRHMLESGQAQTLDNAVSMMLNYVIEESDRQIAESKEYFAEKERMQRESREYQEEKRRKEEAEYQQRREEYARREAQETAWLQEQDRKRQQALDDEIRRNNEHGAYDARRWGKDRQTVRMYDDMLGRSYHERLEEDRKYGYGEKDNASDIGGDLK
ncbi:hypothetical protein P3F89_27285 (plasmid) [Bacillus tropicus]|uniref:Uncharacterized protein n=1 Tax=Bacillus tropicus TaxID=2026188 RepID=A0ABD7ZYV8_9BACI|nr:hypothetical protein [Bacillus tropicus]WMY18301.1 hypothetical protein P3F89_27285 [Bacillus tropicus]